MADTIRATPRNPVLGLFSDITQGGLDYLRDPRFRQSMMQLPAPVRPFGMGAVALPGLFESTGLPKTLERASYGQPLTNIGMANVPLLKPETADLLMTFAPMVGPAIRATKGLPVGMGIKSVGNNPLMNLPSGLTRQDQARLIQSHAENFAAKAKEMGLSASVEHSGSKAGPSSYVTVLDPITGAKFESPFRFSGHSKGPKESQFVYDVGDDFSNELGALEKMALSIPKAERDAIQNARQAKRIEDLASQEKERIFSQGRPAVQSAMQEANLQQTPYTKAFSNSGKYIGANELDYPSNPMYTDPLGYSIR